MFGCIARSTPRRACVRTPYVEHIEVVAVAIKDFVSAARLAAVPWAPKLTNFAAVRAAFKAISEEALLVCFCTLHLDLVLTVCDDACALVRT